MKVKDFITGLFILLAVGAMLTSCEKEPIEEVTIEEVTEEVKLEDMYKNTFRVDGVVYYVDSCFMTKRDDDRYYNKCAFRSVKVYAKNGANLRFSIWQYNRNELSNNYGGTYSVSSDNLSISVHECSPDWYDGGWDSSVKSKEEDNGRVRIYSAEPNSLKFEGDLKVKGLDGSKDVRIYFNVDFTELTVKDHNELYPDYCNE